MLWADLQNSGFQVVMTPKIITWCLEFSSCYIFTTACSIKKVTAKITLLFPSLTSSIPQIFPSFAHLFLSISFYLSIPHPFLPFLCIKTFPWSPFLHSSNPSYLYLLLSFSNIPFPCLLFAPPIIIPPLVRAKAEGVMPFPYSSNGAFGLPKQECFICPFVHKNEQISHLRHSVLHFGY